MDYQTDKVLLKENKFVALFCLIDDHLKRDEVVVIRVAGGSASGKTEVVGRAIIEKYKGMVSYISMDDYCVGVEFICSTEHAGQKIERINWDLPKRYHLNKLNDHLNALRKGKAIRKPIYCKTKREPIGLEILKPNRIILVDGLFLLNPDMIDNNTNDLRVFVDAVSHTRRKRRIERDFLKYGYKVDEIKRNFDECVELMHLKHIEPTKMYADIVIDNN